MIVNQALEEITERLRPGSETPEMDAQVLVAHVLDCPRSWLLAHPEYDLDPGSARKLEKDVLRLEQGEPLPYVIGSWEFYGLTFHVTPHVLIPRPETESLVTYALDWLRDKPEKRTALDVGTGSGCISIALAVNIPDLRISAVDISPQALVVARGNADRLNVSERITFFQEDLFPKPDLDTQYSIIIANLPYIPHEKLIKLPIYGREPSVALDGGEDGLKVIRAFINKAPAALSPGGMILLEIESSQGPDVLSIAAGNFKDAEIMLHQDLAGCDRMISIKT